MKKDIIGKRITNFLKEEILEITFDVIEKEVKNKYKVELDNFVSKKLDGIIKATVDIAEEIKDTQIYKVKFTKGIGKLQESAKYPRYYIGNVVDSKTNKIIEHAKLEKISQMPIAMNSVYSVASVITQQHYLESIDQKLSDISESVEEIKNFLKDEKRSHLESYEHYFKRLSEDLISIENNESHKISVLVELQRIQNEIYSDIQLYKKQLNRKPNSKNEDKKIGIVERKMEEAKEYIASYKYSITLYIYCKFLETMISKTSDEEYINRVVEDLKSVLKGHEEDFELWKKLYNGYLEDVEAYKENKALKTLEIIGENGIVNALGGGVAAGIKVVGAGSKIINQKMQNKKDEKKKEVQQSIDEVLINNNKNLETIIENIELYVKFQNKPIEVLFENGKTYLTYEK